MQPSATPPPSSSPPEILRAALHLYQLYDVSDAIDLELAREVAATPSAQVRPVQSRGGSIEIAQLPLQLEMGDESFQIAGRDLRGFLTARIYDLGIVALRLVLPLAEPQSWEAIIALMAAAQSTPDAVTALFERQRDAVCKTLEPAIERPNPTIRGEDYTLLLIERLGAGMPASQLAHSPVLLQAALGERKPLSAAAESLATALSYYEDDLILLTWDAAVVIEPDTAARDDAALLLEFANLQLLAFRTYDDQVERDLLRITPRIERRSRFALRQLRSSRRFLRELHALIADVTETSARFDNALKVTEDVYWNRVYTAALATLRVEVWRAGIGETLTVLRETAAMLRDEAEAAWTSLLELLVIVLILVELIVAVLGLFGVK